MLPIEQDIIDVERFDAGGSHALSLYLDTDASREAGRNLKAQVKDALAELGPAAEHATADLELATQIALEQIAALHPAPRAAAAFVCPAKGFARVVPLPGPSDRSAHWGTELRLRPLLATLDEHERTVVALVDEEHVRVFRVFLGRIEEVASFEQEDKDLGQHGRSQRKSQGPAHGVAAWMAYGERNLQRRHEWHVRRHLQHALDAMRLDGDRLLIGGVPETAHELWKLLPKRVRERAVLMTGLATDASPSVVLERVLEAQREVEREQESELVDKLLERDRGMSVFGPVAVAEAASDDRIHTLVLAADARLGGAECGACGWLMPESDARACPRCGEAMASRPDLLERMVWRVVRSGGRVEEVMGDARDRIAGLGGLSALLRYVPASRSAS